MNIIIYDDTGKILRTVSTPGEPALQLLPGEKYLEGTANDAAQYIVDGAVTDMPVKPGEFYSFDYSTAQWVLDTVALERSIRARRDQLLASTDWTQAVDVPADTKQKYAEYRQLLRDVPQQPGFPETVVWPTPPAK